MTKTEKKSQGIYAAQKVLDELRAEDPSTFPSTNTSDSPVNVTVGERTYSVVVTYCSNSNFCPSTSSDDTRHLKAVVSFNNKQVYEIETVFTKLTE